MIGAREEISVCADSEILLWVKKPLVAYTWLPNLFAMKLSSSILPGFLLLSFISDAQCPIAIGFERSIKLSS
jgi:hypothetical protein